MKLNRKISSPGLVVMEGYYVPKIMGLNLIRYHTLDGHFLHIFVVKIVLFEKTENKQKEARDGPFKKIKG